uniref:Ig-like domain-containing protein n=1 Tax=Oryzias latipes TaxID=8090 RepID=A0A3B3I7H7_ORYLA
MRKGVSWGQLVDCPPVVRQLSPPPPPPSIGARHPQPRHPRPSTTHPTQKERSQKVPAPRSKSRPPPPSAGPRRALVRPRRDRGSQPAGATADCLSRDPRPVNPPMSRTNMFKFALTKLPTESLVKPSISMDPVGEVSWGQELRITCSTAAELLGETFFLQKISGSFRQTQISASRAATFNISKVNLDHDGSYQCHYEKTVSGQTFTSPLSDLLNRLKPQRTFPPTLQSPKLTLKMTGRTSVSIRKKDHIEISLLH